MSPKQFKLVGFGLLAATIAYVGSYVLIRSVRPACLNTNAGPGAAFCAAFRPLRYVDAARPAYYGVLQRHESWLEAKIDWINHGNGYLYFVWSGGEERAAMIADLADFAEGQTVLLNFRFRLETWDDFRSRLIPEVVAVKNKPNKAPEPTTRLVTIRAAARLAPSQVVAHL